MFRIRHNIIFSATAHSILLAAALLIGGSSEIRKTSLMTVLLSDEKEDSSPGKQATGAVVKQIAQTMAVPTSAMKTATKLSSAQEIIPKQNPAPSVPVRPQSDADSGSVPGVTGNEAQHYYSSEVWGSSPSAVGSQSSRIGSGEGEAGSTSASRGQTGQTAETGSGVSLKQRIRDALQANLVYPYIARKRKMEGTVLMEFRINGRGMPEGVRVVKGSSYSILDEAARETVLKTSPFPAIEHSIEVPIRFSLRGD